MFYKVSISELTIAILIYITVASSTVLAGYSYISPSPIYPPDQIVSWAAFNERIALCYADGEIKILTIKSPKDSHSWEVHSSADPSIQLMAIRGSPVQVGAILHKKQGNPVLRIYSISGGQPLSSIKLISQWTISLGCSDDGRYFFFEDSASGHIYCFDIRKHKRVWDILASAGYSRMPLINCPRVSAVSVESGIIVVTNTTLVSKTPAGTERWKRTVLPGGKWKIALTQSLRSEMRIIAVEDVLHHVVYGIRKKDGTESWKYSVAKKGQLLAVSDDGKTQIYTLKGHVYIHNDGSSGRVIPSIKAGRQDEYRLSPNAKYLYILPSLKPTGGDASPHLLGNSPSTIKWSRRKNELTVIRVSTGKLVARINVNK